MLAEAFMSSQVLEYSLTKEVSGTFLYTRFCPASGVLNHKIRDKKLS